jgi:thiosulfate reductase cytochrome b subunit
MSRPHVTRAMDDGPPTYPLGIRVSHWLSAVALVVMAMSGLEIFNAHPVLYAADDSRASRTVLSLPTPVQKTADGQMHNEMVLFGRTFDTGAITMPSFPATVTLGGWLAGARRLHFATAWIFVLNGLLYVGYMLVRPRKYAVWPGIADLREIGPALRNHLRIPPVLHGAHGGLNPLQKISYFAVPMLLAPFIVATGLALSPQWDALFPWWTGLFGGRQFARTWHFGALLAFVGFIFIHVVLVTLEGPSTLARMVTGGRKGDAPVPHTGDHLHGS